jgi:hemoglobin-like flavoprotein
VGSTPLERHEKVDQYMLGLLGYEMLSGELPETITSLEDLKENGLQAFKSLPTLNELRKDCPGRLTDILHKMTHVSPLKRYANLADALHDLARVSFDSLVLAKESYARCISTLDGGEQFFEAFYTEFLRLSPEAQAMFSHFKDDRARWKRQHLVLRESIYLLFLYAEERDRLREPNVLTRIAELHNKNNINVAHPLYDTFIDALVHSVTGHPPEIPEAFDPRCNLDSAEAEQIETAWRRALEPGIEYMKKRYWSN